MRGVALNSQYILEIKALEKLGSSCLAIVVATSMFLFSSARLALNFVRLRRVQNAGDIEG